MPLDSRLVRGRPWYPRMIGALFIGQSAFSGVGILLKNDLLRGAHSNGLMIAVLIGFTAFLAFWQIPR